MAKNGENEIMRLINQVQDYAEKNKYAYITPEFMLLALLDDAKCRRLVTELTRDKDRKKTPDVIKGEVSEYIDQEVEKTDAIDDISATMSYSKLLKSAISQGSMRVMEPDSLCLFQMLFADPEQASAWLLSQHGIFERDVQEYISKARSNGDDKAVCGSGQLSKYAVDLTQAARDGKIDPLIGRKAEVERITQVMSRRKSSSCVLVGDAGCIEANTRIKIRKIS